MSGEIRQHIELAEGKNSDNNNDNDNNNNNDNLSTIPLNTGDNIDNNNDNNNNDNDEFSGRSDSSSSVSSSSLANLVKEKCGFKFYSFIYREDLSMLVLAWVSRALPVIAAFGCLIFIIVLLATPSNWKTNEGADDDVVLDRESNRGVFVSVLIAILLNCIGCLMFYLKVKESLVVTNYGFILGPVIGYLLDQGIGTDDGFRDFMKEEGFRYTFASLIDGNFMRYIVTVFLDFFISNPLQDIMKQQVKKIGVINYLKDTNNKSELMIKYDSFVVLNYPSILQSIIAFVTFNAYTNQTRFAWAYASSTLDRDLRIPPGTIMLCSAIAGVLYLNFYTIMDYISEREYYDVNTKLLYVLFILLVLYGLNATDTMEAPVEDEDDENYTAFLGSYKPYCGFLVLCCFILYGFVYPLYTRLGCCGKYKPKSSDDHLAEDDDALKSVAEVKHKVSDEVLDKIQEILMISQNLDIGPAREEYEKAHAVHRRKSKRRKN